MDKRIFLPEMQKMPDEKGGKHDYLYNDDITSFSPGQTPSQTVGPFFAYGLVPESYGYDFPNLVSNCTQKKMTSETIEIRGQVFDGENQPVHDALVEIFGADKEGKYRQKLEQDGFTGFARCGTGSDGKEGKKEYQFFTVKPAKIGENQAPYLNVVLTMRGLLNHLFTRIYFDDEDNSNDLVLQAIPKNRQSSLLAQKQTSHLYTFDFYLQGEKETVFFDL